MKYYASFQDIEYKAFESDFFFEKLTNNTAHAHFFYSAFLSASRSVVFGVKSCSKGINGAEDFLAKSELKYLKSELVKKYVDLRNEIIHESKWINPFIQKIENIQDIRNIITSLSSTNNNQNESTLEESKKYFICVLHYLHDFYENYKFELDPKYYYSIEGMQHNNKSIEDIEIELGFPTGWTSISGLSVEERIRILTKGLEHSNINEIFHKWNIS